MRPCPRSMAAFVAVALVPIVADAAPATPCTDALIARAAWELFEPVPPARRASAAWVLGLCAEGRAVGALAVVATRDADATVRSHAAAALGTIGGPTAAAALETALADPASEVRVQARTAFARLGEDGPALSALADPAESEAARVAALDALVAFGRPPSREALDQLSVKDAPILANAVANLRASQTIQPWSPPNAAPPRLALPPAASPVPSGPPSGVPLAVTTALAAGGVWGAGLGLLSQQDSPGVLTLLGTAGAVIGGGTAWGLSRFGVKPTVEQSLWFANTTAWGALAGLAVHAGSGSDSDRLRWGLIVGGETVGIALGAWSASKYRYTAGQTAVADLLVLGSLGGLVGIGRLVGDSDRVSPVFGYGTPPVMVASAIAARYAKLSPSDVPLLVTMPLALGWNGAWLARGLAADTDHVERSVQGGLLVGAGFGFLGATALASTTHPTPERSAHLAGGVATGNVLGLGLHMLAAPDADEHWGAGAAAGGLAVGATAFALGTKLHPGPAAFTLTLDGALLGGFVAGAAAIAADANAFEGSRAWGGVLAAAAIGETAGLVSSRWWTPSTSTLATIAAGTGLGIATGLGVARLTTDERGTADLVGVASGAALGLTGGAFASRLRLDSSTVGAAVAGAGWGALVGFQLPSLGDRYLDPDRNNDGGAWLGSALGAIGAGTTAYLTDARPAQVGFTATAGVLGAGIGYGAGLMVDDGADGTQAGRIGLVAGTTGVAVAALLAERKLALSEGLAPRATPLVLAGAGVGAIQGLLLARAIDPQDSPSNDRSQGGALFGAASGAAAGLVLARFTNPTTGQVAASVSVGGLGGLAAVGATRLVVGDDDPSDDRLVAATSLAGSLVGLAAAGYAQRQSSWTAADGGAAVLGGGVGGLVGALAPSFGDDHWEGFEAKGSGGGLQLGMSAGAIAGLATSHALRATGRDVAFASLGASDGLFTGLGYGMLFDDGEQGARIGSAVGTVAGLGIGGAFWRRTIDGTEERRPGDVRMVLAGTALAGWYGFWIPRLGHANSADVSSRVSTGAVLASAGTASFVTMGLASRLHLDPDLVTDAFVLDALAGGAGALAASAFSSRDDAAAWGLLAGGTLGLVTGAALHDRISFDQSRFGLISFAAAQGTYAGALAPGIVDEDPEDGARSQGALAGLLGGAAVGTVLAATAEPAPRTLGLAAGGSAIGGALTGGAVLLADSIDARVGQGLALSGSFIGLGAGAIAASYVDLGSGAPLAATTGAAIGAGEALVFAWAGRATSGREYAGAGLVGAGVGATLGLASAAMVPDGRQTGLASAGFAAWGAWVGSFSGALLNRDPHEVTFGGLVGANAGFLLGHGLLAAEWVEPRDFGWLSLFGAGGTLLAGSVGAAFSTNDRPEPALAGLAVGPIVGMAVGALALPRLRKLGDPSPPQAQAAGSGRLSRGLRHFVDVGSWMPLVGSVVPPPPGEPGPPAIVMGVTGTLR